MPFIDEESRERYPETNSLKHNLDIASKWPPGDKCFIFYRELMNEWNRAPRWTTAHNLYLNLKNEMPYLGLVDQTAYSLAWQVFFALHVMPYEEMKRQDNGEAE